MFYWYKRTNADAARNLQDFDEVGGGGQNAGASKSACNSDSKSPATATATAAVGQKKGN